MTGHALHASIIAQVADVLRRARKLPVGPARNDLRQLARGLIALHRNGLRANVDTVGTSAGRDRQAVSHRVREGRMVPIEKE